MTSKRYVPRGPCHWPAIVFLLTRAPRTRTELVELTSVRYDSCNRTLAKLEAEGLVVPDGTRGPNKAKVWRWAS